MARPRTPQQREARELALTRPADPYRGALTDPFTPTSPAPSVQPAVQAGIRTTLHASVPAMLQAGIQATVQAAYARPAEPLEFSRPARSGQPGGITLAGILAIMLGLATGVFGLLLVTIVNLNHEYGAPDRSFYRGTDSTYFLLGLLDFGIAALCGVGGIVLLTGKVAGRVAVTLGGVAGLVLAAYWLEDSSVRWFIPAVTGGAAAVMLFAAYSRSATRWLGVLTTPQPD